MSNSIKKCKTIEDGVQAVLDIYQCGSVPKWQYLPAGKEDYVDHLLLDGRKYPLFWWRFDTQIAALFQLSPERKPCSMKLNRACSKKQGLDRLMYKEIDIAEQTLKSDIVSIMNFQTGSSLNMLATMRNERVAVFELSATLHEDTSEQGRHSCWGECGMVSDRVVSQKLPSEAIYLFTDESAVPTTYNDIFIYMYGLEKNEIVRAAAIAEILMGRVDISDWETRDAHYIACIDAAKKSGRRTTRIFVESEMNAE